MRLRVTMLLITLTSAAQAQDGQSIADGATFGAVATLAPLCGLRDEAWLDDLRRAAMHSAADNNQITAALCYGDMEALEDFATGKPDATCAALRQNLALGKADAAVDAFRHRRDQKRVV